MLQAASVRAADESVAQHVSALTRYYRLPGPLHLECGETLPEVEVAYRTWGDPANAAASTVLICHALTASADADVWWPGMIGADAAFDPATDYVVCSNLLGSCYGTTGPASLRTGAAERYRADFPAISVRDMVRVQRLLLDHLGVARLALVTGPSLGGMQAFEWAAMYPEQVDAIAPMGAGGRHSAWCIASSEAQCAAIRADANWNHGYYSDDQPPTKGLAAARMMAVCMYRSWRGFQQRFAREQRDHDTFQVQSYLRHQGDKLNDRFDANCYLRLVQAMNGHDLARGREQYFDVLESITQPVLLVSSSSDQLYPAHELEVVARHMPNATHETLVTDEGHDGFLIKTGPLAAMIRAFRNRLSSANHVSVSGANAVAAHESRTTTLPRHRLAS
ncbi:homoserine O-acetyltransferase MetX [Woeseia oceani]|uniref:Homoserine O-acetyltransferase n=1 Tax=Woeseia oceani TaxID=1548547 RepID=A0A193LFX2_9GAMM|nr:homoserine O-acetyltransferase [Woeseia oceani]ANO51435.1 homoserine O-acetyltransferase [Woeseia oceani]